MKLTTLYLIFVVIFIVDEQNKTVADSTETIAESITLNLKESALRNYGRIIKCLADKEDVDRDKLSKLSFPHDAEAHYRELLDITRPFRNHRPHSWTGYSGPWIENIWIDHFSKMPLSAFGGMFPLFIQWTDIHVNYFMGGNASMPNYNTLPGNIEKLLRDDVIYVTVTQDDEGFTSKLAIPKPNILSLSAGGFGHIPIPLIKGELAYVKPRVFSHDITFLGSLHENSARSRSVCQQNIIFISIGLMPSFTLT